mgnify:CR=1 FL=1|jgi:hypothetical protein
MNNFSFYKQSLDTILENSYKDKNEFKNNLSVIMGAMKYSKTLKEFFTLYNDIDLKTIEDRGVGEKYINESISYLRSNKHKLSKIKPILDKVINKRKDLCTVNENTIYDKIDKIVFNNSPKNIEHNIILKNHLVEHINKKPHKKLNKKINPKTLSYVINKKYDEEYGTKLNETQKQILKNTILMKEDVLNKEFSNITKVVVNRINQLLEESKDENLCARLVETKNKVRGLEPTKKTYIQVRGLLEDLN